MHSLVQSRWVRKEGDVFVDGKNDITGVAIPGLESSLKFRAFWDANY